MLVARPTLWPRSPRHIHPSRPAPATTLIPQEIQLTQGHQPCQQHGVARRLILPADLTEDEVLLPEQSGTENRCPHHSACTTTFHTGECKLINLCILLSISQQTAFFLFIHRVYLSEYSRIFQLIILKWVYIFCSLYSESNDGFFHLLQLSCRSTVYLYKTFLKSMIIEIS